jgi:hypothetical protein
MFTSLARATAIGFVAMVLSWLTMVMITAYLLHQHDGDVALSLGSGPFALASATRAGPATAIGLRPAGFVVALLPLAGLVLIGLRRHR